MRANTRVRARETPLSPKSARSSTALDCRRRQTAPLRAVPPVRGRAPVGTRSGAYASGTLPGCSPATPACPLHPGGSSWPQPDARLIAIGLAASLPRANGFGRTLGSIQATRARARVRPRRQQDDDYDGGSVKLADAISPRETRSRRISGQPAPLAGQRRRRLAAAQKATPQRPPRRYSCSPRS